MRRAARRTTLMGLLLALGALASSGVLVATNASANGVQSNTYLVSAPATVQSGTTSTVTLTIKNEAKNTQIGSANLFWPAPLAVQSASAPGTQAALGTCPVGNVSTPCIQLRHMSLAPGASLVVTISVSAPAACSNVTGSWSVSVRQGVDFSGNNDWTLDPNSNLSTTTVGDTCKYQVTIAPQPPQTIQGGTASTVTATITNESNHTQIGSANLVWPAPLTVQSASIPSGAQPTLASCPVGSSSSPCVQLRQLTLAPGASLVVTMNVTAPPACSDVTGTWSAEVRKSADLSGTNDWTQDPASQLATTVHDHCHLVFAPQPHSAIINQHLTDTDYKPSAPAGAVAVDVLDLSNQPVASPAVAVNVAFGANPGSAALGGTVSQTPAAGVATFSDLSVDKPGFGYTLVASSADADSATSASFDVAGQGTTCNGVPCSLNAPGTGGSGNVLANPTSSSSSGTLVESVNSNGAGPLTCGAYVTNDPNTYSFLTTTSGFTKTVTITITAPLGSLPHYDKRDSTNGPDGDNDYDDVLSKQQLCFQAPYTFTTAPGSTLVPGSTPDGPVWTGLLPNCPVAGGGPCHNRSQDKLVIDSSSPVGYDIVLVAIIPAAAGDPRMA